MIKSLKHLNRGGYVADFRLDEGIRIREDFISPCLQASLKHNRNELTNCILYIEVYEDQERDKERLYRSE